MRQLENNFARCNSKECLSHNLPHSPSSESFCCGDLNIRKPPMRVLDATSATAKTAATASKRSRDTCRAMKLDETLSFDPVKTPDSQQSLSIPIGILRISHHGSEPLCSGESDSRALSYPKPTPVWTWKTKRALRRDPQSNSFTVSGSSALRACTNVAVPAACHTQRSCGMWCDPTPDIPLVTASHPYPSLGPGSSWFLALLAVASYFLRLATGVKAGDHVGLTVGSRMGPVSGWHSPKGCYLPAASLSDP